MTKQLLSGNYLSSFKICINSISIYWNLCPSFTRRDEMFSVSVFWSVFAQAYFSRDFLAVVSIDEKVTKKIFPEKQMIKKVSLPLHADLFLLVDISEVYQTLFFGSSGLHSQNSTHINNSQYDNFCPQLLEGNELKNAFRLKGGTYAKLSAHSTELIFKEMFEIFHTSNPWEILFFASKEIT